MVLVPCGGAAPSALVFVDWEPITPFWEGGALSLLALLPASNTQMQI